MPVQYLLPCECGATVAVKPAQAGDQVTCACGATLDVPSMRGLDQLEQVEVAIPRPEPPAWGARQGLMLLGLLLLLGGGLPAAWLLGVEPPTPQIELAEQLPAMLDQIDEMTPELAWIFWQHEVLGRGLKEYKSPRLFYHAIQLKRRRMWGTVASIVAALGLVLLVAGALLPSGDAARGH